ncbi:DUF1214 domain-containing protein [Mesorhizobium sp. M1066]|uniref:DUF1214 domain-containing protein n=1 Tax=unclassified Mesorhizobium TaxID=325217 RepID=UPI003335BE91
MAINRREILSLLSSASLVALYTLSSARSASASPTPDNQTLSDAYAYLLSRMLVIRQEHMDAHAPAFAYNTIKYNPLGSADFVNPNFDVAYLEGWIAVSDDTAVLLEVPEVQGRYYTAQILDEWAEVVANINERTFPSKPYGKFALVAPGSKAKIPADAARIELHSMKAKILGRVELKGDPDGAVKLQKAFKTTPLGKIEVKSPPKIPDFDNKSLLGAEIFDHADAAFLSALDVSPVAAEMQQTVRAVAAYVASSADARSEVDKRLKEKIIPEFKVFAFTKSAPYRNHWVGGARTGNYGSDFRLRAVVNYAGIWANTTEEVIYFVATRDAEEKELDGSKSYVMHFLADGLPDDVVNAYWSVILVGVPDYRVMQNPLKRYNFNNHSGLQKGADGSLKIGIGPKAIAGIPESNWLPSTAGKPFSLTFRTYVPKDVVGKGQWAPPAVTAVAN